MWSALLVDRRMLRSALAAVVCSAIGSIALAQAPSARDFRTRSPSSGPPRTFQLEYAVRAAPGTFFHDYAAVIGLAADVDMVQVDDAGVFGTDFSIMRLQQKYFGYPVIGA